MAPALRLNNAQLRVFNQPVRLVDGGDWRVESSAVRRGSAVMAQAMGQARAVYRTESGSVATFDATCKHKSAHLGRARAQAKTLLRPHHRWQHGDNGSLLAEPCQEQTATTGGNAWAAEEQDGLAWDYTATVAQRPVPSVPEQQGEATESTTASRYTQACLPSVVMLDTLDRPHFHSVPRIESVFAVDSEVVRSANRYAGKGDTPNFTSSQLDALTPRSTDTPSFPFPPYIKAQPTVCWGFTAEH